MEVNKLVTAWIAGKEANDLSPEKESNWWAIKEVADLHRKDPKKLWEFIQIAYNQNMTEKVQAIFAAGPLEDLICNHGTEYIDLIEDLALKDENFGELLGGVWGIPDEIRPRIERVWKGEWED